MIEFAQNLLLVDGKLLTVAPAQLELVGDLEGP